MKDCPESWIWMKKVFGPLVLKHGKTLTWSIKSWSDLILLCHRIWIQQLLRKHRESPIWWDLFELNGSNFIIFQIGLFQFETNSSLYKDHPPGIFSVILIDIITDSNMKLKFLTVLAVSVLTQEISRNERSFTVSSVSFGDPRTSKAPCFPCSSEGISEPIFQNQQLEKLISVGPLKYQFFTLSSRGESQLTSQLISF